MDLRLFINHKLVGMVLKVYRKSKIKSRNGDRRTGRKANGYAPGFPPKWGILNGRRCRYNPHISAICALKRPIAHVRRNYMHKCQKCTETLNAPASQRLRILSAKLPLFLRIFFPKLLWLTIFFEKLCFANGNVFYHYTSNKRFFLISNYFCDIKMATLSNPHHNCL